VLGVSNNAKFVLREGIPTLPMLSISQAHIEIFKRMEVYHDAGPWKI
jgi:hypothetical protein